MAMFVVVVLLLWSVLSVAVRIAVVVVVVVVVVLVVVVVVVVVVVSVLADGMTGRWAYLSSWWARSLATCILVSFDSPLRLILSICRF